MKRKKLLIKISSLLLILILASQLLLSENKEVPTQDIKGKVVSFKSRLPVIGASIMLKGTNYGSIADKNGDFTIKNIPVGRYEIAVSAIGYDPHISNVVLSSGRQLQLSFELHSHIIGMEDVHISGKKSSYDPINSASLASAMIFSKDDVERFAGSRLDPARMAQNYAGVLGASDERNDIIIRGGSPTELLWRIDGIDVPNPNHFATQGSTGGPISGINSDLLDDSDFLTGAFSAEYYDKMSGVFDLNTRSGNKENYEFMGQFGFNGLELGAEGPLPIRNSSFLAHFRYSFLQILEAMGIDFGYSGTPRYKDGDLKLDFSPNALHKISFTSIFGISNIDMLRSKQKDVATGDFDLINRTDFATFGINYRHIFSEKVYGRLILGSVFGQFRTTIDSITTDGNHNVTDKDFYFLQNSSEGFHTLKYELNVSVKPNAFLTFGMEGRLRWYDFIEQEYFPGSSGGGIWSLNADGKAYQIIAFTNLNWDITSSLKANIGITGQYLETSKKTTLEPRLGLRWQFLPLHTLNIGYGQHRQSLPLLIYYSKEENRNLDFISSTHYILGYSLHLSQGALLKIESYYKDISNAPIDKYEMNAWSFLNTGADFGTVQGQGRSLVSNGLGKAYGAEFSIMKHFSNNYYLLATASYIRQFYKSSDNEWRTGAFDNLYVFNLLGGYELIVSPSFTMEFSCRYSHAGGRPYRPLDLEKSKLFGRTTYSDKTGFIERADDYSRFDIRIDFRHNMQNISVISYVSIENLFAKDNFLTFYYDSKTDGLKRVNQLGFFPIGGVRVEF